MIEDSLIIYLLFQLILLVINIIGITKMPLLSALSLIGIILICVPTMIAFGDYYLVSTFLILVNVSIPIIGLSRTFK